ncbi:hypothetical protein [Phytoactinopolyspora limicola]|uniref:hypothetical protein n=1 Tax=Phytoactinopolyspora limicola TaxID=2715536 RepID=UPI00140AC6EC|nr:hypothetical protein [Phytoactinopolyspora limicola]
MDAYEITLIIDREPSDAEIEDAFESLDGLGMTGIETSDTGVLIHFEAEAESMSRAIVNTTFGLQRVASLNVRVVGIHSEDLVTLKDIAQRTGRSYESVRLLANGRRGPGHFPRPLSAGTFSLYSWEEVLMWLATYQGTTPPGDYGAVLAAADLLIRAGELLGQEQRCELAPLLTGHVETA